MKKRILGLDTGTNSLGWAVVDRDENGIYDLIDKGVFIFQEGVKIEKGIESSKAAERTSHRSLRRQYFRRRLRKIEVLKVLIKYNLCPTLTEDDLKLWHTRKIYPRKEEFMQWQRTSESDDINPYHFRHICLNVSLDLTKQSDRYILGRAMYHLAQRRGFLSNRLDTSEEDQSGAVKSGIANLSEEMAQAGCKYLGEYFYKLYHDSTHSKYIRTRYIDREQHYMIEFNAICDKQQLDEKLRSDLYRALYFQRPLKSQRQSVGKCTFEKNKARCSDSHPMYEEFRMLSFLNNIKIMGPYDDMLRPLNEEELQKVESLFYRKSKPNFDFEEIAKKIAGKGKYQWKDDKEVDKPYKFNYRMSQGVPGCPTIAQLRDIFGENWIEGIAETYNLNTKKDGTIKSKEEMACDIWNVLFFFSSRDKLKEYGIEHLQLDEELAEKFSKIRLSRSFASMSLKVIRKMLPFLRIGMNYSHSMFMANIPKIVGMEIWNDEKQREYIISKISAMSESKSDKNTVGLEDRIKDFLAYEYNINEEQLETLYHPSMTEIYPDACPNKDTGVVLLGSPRTNAIRNPMAMRSLHEVRKVVNTLIKEGKIGPDTEVHIEYARELNNANMRAAISQWQRDQEKKHKHYGEEIRRLYKDATGWDIEPSHTDILKYQLWEEQNHICLYTGKEIGIAEFLGSGPMYDIEHTIPRSVGGDSTQENLTLCECKYNRDIKKAKIPSQLDTHDDILVRIQHWKDRSDELTKQIDKISTRGVWDKGTKDGLIRKKNKLKIERDYWNRKYMRFTMTEVPEGFALRQGAGIGLISKYAALYLKSYFHDANNPDHRQVYSVKGALTADFRKMWGIQEEYEKKSRNSHTHHCIDAIVIACIGKHEFAKMAEYHREDFTYRMEGKGVKPVFEKPWSTFTQDLKQIAEEQMVVHDTTDNMPKKAKKTIDTIAGKKSVQGDCARGSLHQDTYYGAIERDGEIRYVVRRQLSSFTSEKELNVIVDDSVRQAVQRAVVGRDFKKAIAEPIYMNKEKGILIKKVRCYADSVKSPLHIRYHRDQSTKDYKQQYHVMNDSNYCIAIYEGLVKGKLKRDFEMVNMLDAAAYYKKSADARMYPIVPEKSRKELPLKQILKIGTTVLLYEKSPKEIAELDEKDLYKRCYKVYGLSSMTVTGGNYGLIKLRHIHEARPSSEVKAKNGVYVTGEELRPAIAMLHTQIKALVEDNDFEITPTGKIKLKK